MPPEDLTPIEIEQRQKIGEETHTLLERGIELNARNHDESTQLSEIGIQLQAKQLEEIQKGNEIQKAGVKFVMKADAEVVNLKGAKGDKGDKGEDGKTPVKGKDYFTPKDIDSIVQKVNNLIPKPKDGKTPVKGEDYFTAQDISELVKDILVLIPKPKDGKDGTDGEDVNINEVVSLVLAQIEKPKDGKDGYTPVKGKDYFTKKEVKEITDGIDSSLTSRVQTLLSGRASKTVSLKELDDVDLSALTVTNGKYVLGGGSGAVDSVNSQTGVVVLDADDIDDTSTAHKFVTAGDITKLGNLSGTNTGDQDLSSYLTSATAASTYQPLDADLTTLAGLTATTNNFIIGVSSAWASRTPAQALVALGLTSAHSPQFAGINLGNATDTTLARSSAGVMSVEGVVVPTVSSTNTLTNKRVTPRITSITSSATPTINTDNCDAVTITALATAITSMTTNLSGTPTDFQRLIFRIKDNGTNRAITWGASFEAKGVALPTTTTASKVLTVGFLYDTVTSKWGCVASVEEA